VRQAINIEIEWHEIENASPFELENPVSLIELEFAFHNGSCCLVLPSLFRNMPLLHCLDIRYCDLSLCIFELKSMMLSQRKDLRVIIGNTIAIRLCFSMSLA
jgi:hypothetical protein